MRVHAFLQRCGVPCVDPPPPVHKNNVSGFGRGGSRTAKI